MSVNLGNDTKASSPVRTPEETKESKYEPKQNKKIIRLLTVIAYVISVSMAAIILSLYYVFLWDPESTYKEKHTTPLKDLESSKETPTLISKPFSSGTNEPVDMEDPQPTPFVLPVVEDGLPPEDNSKAEHILPTGTAGATHQEPGDSSLHTNNVEQRSSRTHQDYRDTKHRRLQQPDTRGPLAANA